MSSKLEYVARCLSRGTHKKYETLIINEIYSRLNNPNLEIATQQHVVTKNDGTKYIDLYFPQLKIAVEVDEWYHNSEEQAKRDKRREENIRQAVLESTIVDLNNEIHFERIVLAECWTLELLFKRIDEVVSLVNESINKLPEPLIWNFTEEEKTNEITKRGYLQRGDSFRIMADIIRIFGVHRNGNGCGRCTYKLKNKQVIWSPTLSLAGSNKDGWVNTISEDLTKIYESGVDGKGKSEGDYKWDVDNRSERIVFLKYKDALGFQRRRFLGVYVADYYDHDKKAEVWKLKEETVNIKIQ